MKKEKQEGKKSEKHPNFVFWTKTLMGLNGFHPMNEMKPT
jgi:hypothetical protein